MPEMKIPGPDHPLSITHCPRRVEALYHGHIIADSDCALVLQEDGKQTYFFPREDVMMDVLAPEAHTAHCNYKGDARYWRIFRDGKFAEHGAWSYDNPYPAAEELRGMIAFDPDWVTVHIDDKGDVRASAQHDKIGEYIRHTDSGSGRSQEAPWPPTVARPDPESGELEDDEGLRP